MRSPRRQIPNPKRKEITLGLEIMRTRIRPKNPTLDLQGWIVFRKEELGIFL
jgi:hypothetical protein